MEPWYQGAIDAYLVEDLGPRGDITSNAVLDEDTQGAACIVARDRCYVVGLDVAAAVFQRLGAEARPLVDEGSWQEAGAGLLVVEGRAREILAGERLALNILSRMCGIGTVTRPIVEALEAAEARAKVAATRKTTPGFRIFEKEAVVRAGGEAHRAGLWDAAMIKDNHRAAAGSVAEAVAKVRAAAADASLCVEVESLDDAMAAAEAGAHWIMIDNQDPETGAAWASAVRDAYPAIRIEASGGISPSNVVDYGWADRVSLGALTQGYPVPDLGLDWKEDA